MRSSTPDEAPTGAVRPEGTPPADAAPEQPSLIAYRLKPSPAMPLVPAGGKRAWMDATDDRWAYRCLPLLMANQSGWFVLNSQACFATWGGGPDPASLKITYVGGTAPYPVESHFGYGILTWRLPYLFRTPPGYNLLVRGPANWPKDGAYALEGLVETDWSVATFTVNWKLTRPNLVVPFSEGEPICMLVPSRRGELEEFQCSEQDIGADRQLAQRHQHWAASREQFKVEHPPGPAQANDERWQKHYFRGQAPGGVRAPEHATKRQLRPFSPADGAGAR